MKPLGISFVSLIAVTFLTAVAHAHAESVSTSKEVRQVASAPAPECNWTGFYVGVNGGAQFGRSHDTDVNGYQLPNGTTWSYDESGFVVGGQLGYNWQWRWLVLGPEFDFGYMNLDGHDLANHRDIGFNPGTYGKTGSDFYATFKGRIGFAWDKWLFYATGGGIAVNYRTDVVDHRDGLRGIEMLNASRQDLDRGWTAGGGAERMIGCHWSIKAEYLRYTLDNQDFSGRGVHFGGTSHFIGDTEGNIIRAGLNYRF